MAQILIVDDEEVVCKTLKRLLDGDGIVATTVFSAKAARTLMARDRFDLLIIDMKMPEMDGIALLNKLRSESEYAETTVVICTGFATPKMKDEALKSGANYFIEKPFEAEEMLSVVKKSLGMS